jgi:hypothetical protein
VEQAFNNSVSAVYKAYWTQDVKTLLAEDQNYEITLEELLRANQSEIDFDEEGKSIELTQEI